MSKVQQIVCDAPKCNQVRREVNGWFILRADIENSGSFRTVPMHGNEELPDDQHICSSPCLHALLETWIESHQAKPTVEVGGPFTNYEVGSGDAVGLRGEDGVDHKGDAVYPYSGRR